MTAPTPEAEGEPGSFRDPSGRVYYWQGRVFRTVSAVAAPDYEFMRDSGLLADLVARKYMLPATECDRERVPAPADGAPAPAYIVEHPRLRFVSHPYEWPFRALQRAAIFHLDLHLSLLDRDATLSDATAYNVQFEGPLPVYIDLLSVRRYVDGEFWIGHRQFCEQFLNPLLLQAMSGVSYNEWYRGRIEGIPATDLSPLLPVWQRLSPRMLAHVTLQAAAQQRVNRKAVVTAGRKLPKSALAGMLRSLRKWISTLKPDGIENTTWSDYAGHNSYAESENSRKHEAVAEFVRAVRPARMFDVGCNTGAFAETALQSGAGLVVGLDADHGALNGAFERAEQRSLELLPLFMDLGNPSPDQGWGQRERRGLNGRAPLDAAIALAIVHHLAIGRNLPLRSIAQWLASLAPRLLVEFVPKQDPMVQLMLSNRVDIFPDYTADCFRSELSRIGRVISETALADGGRLLFEVDCAPAMASERQAAAE